MSKNKITISLIILLSTLISGCVSGYKEFYTTPPGFTQDKLNKLRASPAPLEPQVDRAALSDSIAISRAYEKKGFVLIGTSSFNSGRNESDAAAIAQGKSVGADLVIIFSPQYTGSITSSVPITTPTTTTSYSSGTATAYGSNGSVTAYGSGTTTTHGTKTSYIPITVNRSDYAASYFVKVTYKFGARLNELDSAQRQRIESNKGVIVEMVVDNTPAFNADVLPGDIILSIDDSPVLNPDWFSEQISNKSGKEISLKLYRNGKVIYKNVALNN